jgi:nickel-dependent lactate racemase
MIGAGHTDRFLADDQVRQWIASGLGGDRLAGKRVLVLVPDSTRTAPLPMLFAAICDTLLGRVAKLDFLVALGTHPPMPDERIRALVGIRDAERTGRYAEVGLHNHLWNDPAHLTQVGVIGADEVGQISGGLLRMDVPVVLNRMVLDADVCVIVCPVFPHEVAGFSGGHKYLFPGIAAEQIINFTHWLGALITNWRTIGYADTPVRATIERAAEMVPTPRLAVSFVVKGHGDLAGLWVGDVQETWRAAAALSERLHIVYKDHPYQTVLSQAPEMYDDIWTAGKCMYKLEPVVADGGELIIYAPHVTEVSYTHGRVLDEVGYHVRDFFVAQWERYKGHPWGVLAHSTHVRGVGTYEDGVERPRITVTLATGIPKDRCERINLAYRDPDSIRPQDYGGREDEGVLYVSKAGEMLHRLASERPNV